MIGHVKFEGQISNSGFKVLATEVQVIERIRGLNYWSIGFLLFRGRDRLVFVGPVTILKSYCITENPGEYFGLCFKSCGTAKVLLVFIECLVPLGCIVDGSQAGTVFNLVVTDLLVLGPEDYVAEFLGI